MDFICVDCAFKIHDGAIIRVRKGEIRCERCGDRLEEKIKRENRITALVNVLSRQSEEDARVIFDRLRAAEDAPLAAIIEAYGEHRADLAQWGCQSDDHWWGPMPEWESTVVDIPKEGA